jgi:hypothetical protein
MDKDKAISPEWLKAHGFVEATPAMIEEDFYPWNLDYPINEGDLLYAEKEFDRRRFAVILSEPSDGDTEMDSKVFVQDDVGCGYTNIPSGFCAWPEYNFLLLYEAIRTKTL